MSVRRLVGIVAIAAAGMVVPLPTGAAPGAGRTSAEYKVPEVKLVRDDGKSVSLPQELNDGRPVAINFIFTSCTTICPLITQTFVRLQEHLGSDRDRVHLVSISIDPEEDTPERLAEYAKRYHAGPEWQHYTGSMQAIIATQQAFGVYRGDKMSHTPVTLVRVAPGKPWVRFDGFASPEEILQELREQGRASN